MANSSFKFINIYSQSQYDSLGSYDNSTLYVILDSNSKVSNAYIGDQCITNELPIASSSVLGGIKVGDNLSITSDGTLSVAKADGTDTLGVVRLTNTYNNGMLGLEEGRLWSNLGYSETETSESNRKSNVLYNINDGVYLGNQLLSYEPSDEKSYSYDIPYSFTQNTNDKEEIIDDTTTRYFIVNSNNSSFSSENSGYPPAYNVTFNTRVGSSYLNCFAMSADTDGTYKKYGSKFPDCVNSSGTTNSGIALPCSLVVNSDNQIIKISIKIGSLSAGSSFTKRDGNTYTFTNGQHLVHYGPMDGRSYDDESIAENSFANRFCFRHSNSADKFNNASKLYTVTLYPEKGEEVSPNGYTWASNTYKASYETNTQIWNVGAYDKDGNGHSLGTSWQTTLSGSTSTNTCTIYAGSIADGYNSQYWRHDPNSTSSSHSWKDATYNFYCSSFLNNTVIVTFTAN